MNTFEEEFPEIEQNQKSATELNTKFLTNIRSLCQLEDTLLQREKYLTELAFSPINHKEQLRSLFTSNSMEDILRDLEVYNSVSGYIEILKSSNSQKPKKPRFSHFWAILMSF